jgi:hypothetical protein
MVVTEVMVVMVVMVVMLEVDECVISKMEMTPCSSMV